MRRLLLKLLRRRRFERDMAAEMAFHRQMAAEAGNAVRFGNQARLAEEARDVWRFVFIENLWRDVVHAVRGALRRPGLALSATLSLALGIGANTAIFSLAVELLLSEPSVTDPGSLVYVRDGRNSHAPDPILNAVRQSGVFLNVAGENEESTVNWNDGQDTRSLFSVATTGDFFASLGVPVALGRGILPGDSDTVVITDRFWRRQLGGDSAVLGRSLNLNGRPRTIVGVLHPWHRTLIGYGFSPDVYVAVPETSSNFAMYARLKPGTTTAQARAVLAVLATQPVDGLPPRFSFANVQLSPIAGMTRLRDQQEAVVVGAFFIAVLLLVTLVLLVACVNVAGLLLAQASARRREIAVRLALGASRGRLLQQLLSESLVLCLAGTGLGLLLAIWLGRWVSEITLPIPLPLFLHIPLDWRAMLYASMLTGICTIVSGLMPAWQSTSQSFAPDLARHRRLRVRRALLVGQVALSCVVLVTAMLSVRNLLASQRIAPGFDVDHTVLATVEVAPGAHEDEQAARQYVARTVDAIKAVPGVDAAGAARIVPFNGALSSGFDMAIAGADTRHVGFANNRVSPDFFRVMGIPVRQGRTFTDGDDGRARVVIVNTTFVERYLSGLSPLGLRFSGYGPDNAPYEIVGVVAPTKTLLIGEDDRPQLYEPLSQAPCCGSTMHFVARSAMPPAEQAKAIRTAMREADQIAAIAVAPMKSRLGLAFVPSQISAVLLGSVGALGLLLVAIGLFGTMSYAVVQRTPEIGLRLAVGATPADVIRLMVGDSVRLVALGIGIGALAAWFLTAPLAQFFVPDLSPRDPVTFFAVFVAMAATTVAATWIPARRAAGIEPTVSLRAE